MLSTIIIGGGPGGLGPLLWAAQQGLLTDWLDQGVALVEARRALGGSLGRFGIASDSVGGSYLECLDALLLPPALQTLREAPVCSDMARYSNGLPPLGLVDRFMRHLGSGIASLFERSEHSSLHLGTRATAVHLQRDNGVVVHLRGPGRTRSTLAARSAVVALGGRLRDWRHAALLPGLTVEDCRQRLALPSDRILSRAGLREAARLLDEAGSRRIVIVGGAHSAYSVAGALLTLPGAARLSPGQIVILQRRPPRIYYTDRAAAERDGYPVEDGAICPRTLRVNRMGGLRGDGRDMWRRLTGRPGATPEPRLVARSIGEFGADDLRREIEEAAFLVPCLGYRSSTLPVFDPAGRRIELQADADGVAVDEHCRLLDGNGASLPNLFGIGLGTGYRLPAEMGGEPSFDGQANSLWLYQNDIGAVIHGAIQDLVPRSQVAPASIGQAPPGGRSEMNVVPVMAATRLPSRRTTSMR